MDGSWRCPGRVQVLGAVSEIRRLALGGGFVEISGVRLERCRIQMQEPNIWRRLGSNYPV